MGTLYERCLWSGVVNKFWDLYLNGRWIGMSIGDNAQIAIRPAVACLPDVKGQMRVIFYGEF